MIEATDSRLNEYERCVIGRRVSDTARFVESNALVRATLGIVGGIGSALLMHTNHDDLGAAETLLSTVDHVVTAAHCLDATVSVLNDTATAGASRSCDDDEETLTVALRQAAALAGLVGEGAYGGVDLNRRHAVRCLAEIVECLQQLASAAEYCANPEIEECAALLSRALSAYAPTTSASPVTSERDRAAIKSAKNRRERRAEKRLAGVKR